MSKRYGTLADRFHNQYIPEPNSGCWIWTGAIKSQSLPYGRIRLPDSRKSIFAHRVSYEIEHEVKLRREDFVCHSCDNPICVNPGHLFLGDKFSNMLDRDRKQRQKRGSSHGNSKLAEADIVLIRNASGTQKEIADKFGIDQTNVSLIQRRQAWKHVA